MRKALLITFILLILSGGAILGLIWYGADSIQKAAMTTEILLFAEPIVGQDNVITWLEEYHGEAPGHQVMITFASGSIRNSERTREIIERLSEVAIDRLAWSIYDSGQEEQFLLMYGKHTTGQLGQIVSLLRKRAHRQPANQGFSSDAANGAALG